MRGLSEAIDFQSQALVLRAERQRLMASNIANADTPGYQAREMDFANALRQATRCQRDASGCTDNVADRCEKYRPTISIQAMPVAAGSETFAGLICGSGYETLSSIPED